MPGFFCEWQWRSSQSLFVIGERQVSLCPPGRCAPVSQLPSYLGRSPASRLTKKSFDHVRSKLFSFRKLFILSKKRNQMRFYNARNSINTSAGICWQSISLIPEFANLACITEAQTNFTPAAIEQASSSGRSPIIQESL